MRPPPHSSLIGGSVECVRAGSPGSEKQRWLGEPSRVMTSALAFQLPDLVRVGVGVRVGRWG